ncbi:NAD-dependent epimerase/dehydratase family protein [Amnibacterium kyonggiense]|uniref:NAD-dependent epimerase/dehydratase family protein n=1 Tax=Amnibacterium kyonggiense TaxID=595671 RepID=A0A4R7FTG8_9MICO|nr:NAD(P)-dependent oxidoreductase [Amnibacterium kyonggiense]TDS81009.1 NAD-dependent epimerase/dehydratase family protein [Amnibacterium kyonggiense]
MAVILLTGAAGSIGTAVAPLLRAAGHRLRLLDLVEPPAASADDDVRLGSAVDDAAMQEAARGVDLVVHLASHASERSWRDIVDVNVESTRVALDAAHLGGAAILLASSVHAAGCVPSDEAGDGMPRARPDTYYGFSKAAAEALGDLYADRFGMRIVSARIMTFGDRPHTARARSTWLSPADFARLVEASLDVAPGNHVVWGVSANTRRTVDLAPGRAIGYEPQDDAEDHVDALATELGLDSPADIRPVGSDPLGGVFTTHPLGTPGP